MTAPVALAARLRPQVMESFRDLAALGSEIGGRYLLAAGLIEAALGSSAQARMARRDAAIVALRGFVDEPSESSAAAEIVRRLHHYAASAWERAERSLSSPPAVSIGTEREWCWRVLHAGGGNVPGHRRIRQILAAERIGNETRVDIANVRRDRSGRQIERRPMTAQSNVLELLSRTPEFARAIKQEGSRIVAERRQRLAEIARLDEEGRRAWPRQEKKKSESLARLDAAFATFKAASAEHQNAIASVERERLASESERRRHEIALMNGCPSEQIDAFARECHRELDRVRETAADSASAQPRIKAILASLRNLNDLRIMADLNAIPTEIARIRASWPTLSEVSAA